MLLLSQDLAKSRSASAEQRPGSQSGRAYLVHDNLARCHRFDRIWKTRLATKERLYDFSRILRRPWVRFGIGPSAYQHPQGAGRVVSGDRSYRPDSVPDECTCGIRLRNRGVGEYRTESYASGSVEENAADRDPPWGRASGTRAVFPIRRHVAHAVSSDVSIFNFYHLRRMSPFMRPSSFSLITLHRLSLVDHPRLVLQNLSHPRLQGQPFLHFLESSESICTHSARSVLTTLDACTRTSPKNLHYWTLHSVGTAIFALSLHTCRHSATWQARADLEVSRRITL
jgi:hypothetical protein